jgi:hypothetical protein
MPRRRHSTHPNQRRPPLECSPFPAGGVGLNRQSSTSRQAGAIRFLLANKHWLSAFQACRYVDAPGNRHGHGKAAIFRLPSFRRRAPPPPSTALRSIRPWKDGTTKSPLHPCNGIGGRRVFSADTQTAMLAGLSASTTTEPRFDDSRVLQFTPRIAFRAFIIDVRARTSTVTSFIFIDFSNSFRVCGLGLD